MNFIQIVFYIFIIIQSSITEAKSYKKDGKCAIENQNSYDPFQEVEFFFEDARKNTSNALLLNLPDQNKKPEVITLSLSPKGNGKVVSLQVFRYKSLIHPSKGTIIFLCGGPGTCLSSRPPNIPKGYDVIGADYIGLGRNKLNPAPPEMMSIEGQAEATKKIIESLKLKNYAIYGTSFGTTVATVTAHLISKDEKMIQPKSVVLEGTVSDNAIQDFKTPSDEVMMTTLQGGYGTRLNEKYNKLKETLSKDELHKLNRSLAIALSRGRNNAVATILGFIRLNYDDFKKRFSVDRDSVVEPFRETMYSASGCQIYYKGSKNHQKLGKLFGDIVDNPYYSDDEDDGNLCDCRTIKRNYDPANFQIKAPILYINGDSDPMTPLEGAMKHMQGQKHAKSKTVLIDRDGGGHGPTFDDLSHCNNLIFDSAISGDFKKFEIPNKDYKNACEDYNQSLGSGSTLQLPQSQ